MQAAAPGDTTIVAAQMLDEPVPNCRVEGYVTTTNPGPNKNNFRLQLPQKAQWKGRYYFIGLGGSAGYVPTDSQIPSGNPLLKGFVVAGTDTGHQANMLDWSFLTDPARAVDHIHRGAHVVAVATQQITKSYYGVDKLFRYESGCSGGGRMGMEAITRHPEDYDGSLIGTGQTTEMSDTALEFIEAAQQMTREPGSWLAPAKLKMVDEKVTAACDATDGAVDGVVWDHRLCKFDVATLACKKGDAPDCLTQPEIKSIKAILKGPPYPRAHAISQHMPISNMSEWSMFVGPVPPPWSPEPSIENMRKSSGGFIIATTMARSFFGPDFDIIKDFHFNDPKQLDAWYENVQRVGYSSGFTTDLHGLQKSGGKAIFWNGVSDPCCSNVAAEEYFVKVAKTLQINTEQLESFARLYEIPGMGHCGGGTGPNDAPDQLLQALIDWVEQGKAPTAVVMHRGADRVKLAFIAGSNELAAVSGVHIPVSTGRPRDFLVCPFPQVSVFDKSKATVPGAVFEAVNWSCRASR
jgi:feruloyl esterase